VAAFVIICGALWITARLLMVAGDQFAGVVENREDKEPSRFRFFATPVPEPQQELRFSR
jgi:hypothetical protein